MLVIALAHAATVVSDAPEAFRPAIAAVIDRCVAERPWWGGLTLRVYPAGEGEAPADGVLPLTAQLAYDHGGYAIVLSCKAGVLDCRR